jgi:hypothetical protein
MPLPWPAIGARLALVASPSASLDDLVRDELRPLVRRLIVELAREELAAMANGRATIAVTATETPSRARRRDDSGSAMPTVALAKTCTRCGVTKAANAFNRGRRVCRSCRTKEQRDRDRQRRAPAPSPNGDEEPGRSPAPADTFALDRPERAD